MGSRVDRRSSQLVLGGKPRALVTLLFACLLVACTGGEEPGQSVAATPVATTSQGLATCVTLRRDSGATFQDAQITSDSADAAKANESFGGSPFAQVGQTGTPLSRMLVQTSVASIPTAATVVSATLQMNEISNPGKPVLGVRQVLSSWSESTVTWSSIGSAFSPTVAATLDTASVPNKELTSIDVTGLVQSWVNGTLNHGLVLEAISGGRASYATSEAGPADHRPQLVVCYIPPTCSDEAQNGAETGVDCGGSCPVSYTHLTLPTNREV